MVGFAEQLQFLETVSDEDLEPHGGRAEVEAFMRKAATAACECYIDHSAADGIPYWDTGTPGLALMGDYLARPAEPFNDREPVDSSAAAIAAQGLLRPGCGAASGISAVHVCKVFRFFGEAVPVALKW